MFSLCEVFMYLYVYVDPRECVVVLSELDYMMISMLAGHFEKNTKENVHVLLNGCLN